jgi:hypothetical protein
VTAPFPPKGIGPDRLPRPPSPPRRSGPPSFLASFCFRLCPNLEKKKPDALRDAPSPSLGVMGYEPISLIVTNSRTFEFAGK